MTILYSDMNNSRISLKESADKHYVFIRKINITFSVYKLPSRIYYIHKDEAVKRRAKRV
jgi:hypothetical protein